MMKKMVRFTVMALLAAGILILGGCPEKIEDDEPIDPALVGSWSNGESGNNRREFIIYDDGSFSATLNPGGEQGNGRVNGKLTRDGHGYIMSGMTETTGATWGSTVTLFSGNYIQIELSNNNDTFTLISDNPPVQTFFGGDYHRQQ